MARVDHETLVAWLTRLQLTAIRDQLDNLLDEAADKKLTLREALAFLVEREVARKDERRIEMALKIAHFPMVRESPTSTSRPSPASTGARCESWRRRGGWLTGTRSWCSVRPGSARRIVRLVVLDPGRALVVQQASIDSWGPRGIALRRRTTRSRSATVM